MVENSLPADETGLTNQNEENPILVAQRYLNIFHQMHIFDAKKKAEFEKSLVEMPERYRELLPTIPGGRILLDYILDLEGAKHEAWDVNHGQSAAAEHINASINAGLAASQPSAMTPLMNGGGTVNLAPDFAKNLAGSLAVAFKNNNLAPGGNLNELSAVISKSFSTYAQNMQQLTSDILSQNMVQLAKAQNQMQEQMNKQIDWQTNLQNKLSAQINQRIEQTQQQMQTQMDNQLSWQNKMQEQFEQSLTVRANHSAPTSAQQLNAQTNNANTTTINNVNFDSSCFNNITKAIRETENRRSEDFKRIIEVLNKNFSKNVNHQTVDLPVAAITNSITEALRENSKQQLAAIKAFGETLSQTIRQSQQELAKTLGKSFTEVGERHVGDVLPLPITEKPNQENISQQNRDKKDNQQAKKNKNTEKNQVRDNKPEIKNEANKNEKTPSTKNITDKKAKNESVKEKSLANPLPLNNKTIDDKDGDINLDFMKDFEDKSKSVADISFDETFTEATGSDIDLSKVFEEIGAAENKKNIDTKIKPVPTDVLSEVFFTSTQPKTKEPLLQKAESVIPATSMPKPAPAPKPKPKPSPQAHFYDDAMQKIKDALQSEEAVALNELDDINTVSLNGEPVDDERPTFVDTPLDDDFLSELGDDEAFVSKGDNSDEWAYVDEDGNPVEAGDDEEWVYVDEDGNPVEAGDDEEWVYVDEDGNPVEESDDDEWAYVDEDGNPVEASDDDEWVYVDEDGNPVETPQEETVDNLSEPKTDDDILNALKENVDK